ncbi:MAG: hypothetical protein SNG35_04195 [Rikenellaceae bacterium]
MKSFKFSRRSIDRASNVVNEIREGARRQNRLYATIFILLLIFAGIYILRRVMMDSYDGFIVTKDVDIRHSNDIEILEYHVKPGDRVNEGDTLYSYMVVDLFNQISNPLSSLDLSVRRSEAQREVQRLQSSYQRERYLVDSLHDIVGRYREDVRLGLKITEALTGQEWLLNQHSQELRHIGRLITIQNRAVDGYALNFNTKHTSLASVTESQRKRDIENLGFTFDYRLAYVDMTIVEISAPCGVMTQAGECVITYSPTDNPKMTDLHVKMMLMPKQFHRISEGMIFDLYAGNDYLGEVRTTYTSTYLKVDPNNKESHETVGKQNVRNLALRAEFINTDTIPYKYMVDRYPVNLRRYKWNKLRELAREF